MSSSPYNNCPVCQVGRLHPRSITYSRVFHGMLISVPDTPLWQCDYCHQTSYDQQLMLRIDTTIEQVGPPNRPHSRNSYQPEKRLSSNKR